MLRTVKELLMVVVFLAGIHAGVLFDVELDQWESFKDDFSKFYETEDEEGHRKKIFKENLQLIAEHNKKYEQGVFTYVLGITQFADMTQEEFAETLTGINEAAARSFHENSSNIYEPSPNTKVAESLDWRTKSAVTPIKDQKRCGSCWAFGATGALEGQFAIKKSKLVSLSEQNLVDCDSGSRGCDGGWPSLAFEYVKNNGGIDTEQSYPYEAVQRNCRYKPEYSAGTCTGVVTVPRNEDALLKAVHDVGPISVAVNAEPIQLYKHGIFDGNCSAAVNHAVLVVGYSSDNGTKYWILKNSWGTNWGEEGYFRLKRDVNMCGIRDFATYPEV